MSSLSPLGSSLSVPPAPPSIVAGADALQSGSREKNPPAASGPNAYQQGYANLQTADAAELLQVSLAPPSAAEANVQSVLAQAAALQQQQPAPVAQHVTIADATLATPTFASIANASDASALATIRSVVDGTGSLIDTSA